MQSRDQKQCNIDGLHVYPINVRLMRFTPIDGLAIMIIAAFLVAILFPVFAVNRSGHRETCFTHLRRVGIAASLYTQDYGSQLPPARDWVGSLSIYEQPKVFKCPDAAIGVRTYDGFMYGYAYYSMLSSRKVASIAGCDTTPLIYDSIMPGRNVRDPFTSIPLNGRHQRYSMILFADYHVKGKKSEQINTIRAGQSARSHRILPD